MPRKRTQQQQRRKRNGGGSPGGGGAGTTSMTAPQRKLATTASAAGNAAAVQAKPLLTSQAPTTVAPKAVPANAATPKTATPNATTPKTAPGKAGPAVQQAPGPAVYKNQGERMAWMTPHLEQYQALSKKKQNQLDALPYPVTSAQLDDKLTELQAPTAPKLSPNLKRAAWAVEAGLSSESKQAGTLGHNSIGTVGGTNMHLTLYRDTNRELDVSLGFRQLFSRVVQEDQKPPLHVTVELDGQDAPTNPRAYGNAAGAAWVRNVDAGAADALGVTKDDLTTHLKKAVKDEVSLMRTTLRPRFLARGGTKQ